MIRRTLLAFAALAAASVARAEPAKIDQLVIRSWPGPWDDAMVEVGSKFTAKTKIKVAYDHRSDGVMTTLLQTAAAQHRTPPVDVFYTFDFHAKKADMRGLLNPMTVAEVPNLANMMSMSDPEGGGTSWPWVNVGADVVTLLYRGDKFPQPPKSYAVMFDPAYKGRVLFYSVPQYTLNIVALINHWSVPDDMDKIWGFIQAKLATQNPILGGDPETVGGFERNEIDLTVSYPAIARQLAPIGVKITRPKEGLIGNFEAVAIPKGLDPDHRYWAEQFVNFLLSPEVLTQYCHRLMVACLRKGIPSTDAELADPAFPKSEEELQKIVHIPVGLLAKHDSEWSAHYDEILK